MQERFLYLSVSKNIGETKLNKERQDRLQYLRKQRFLSDQEHEELEKLEDDFKLEEDESKEFNPRIKKEKRTIASILIEKFKSKPATKEQIEQLKLEVEMATLKRKLAEEKAKTPNRLAKILKVLSDVDSKK